MSVEAPCPCASGRALDACCGRLLQGEVEASTAEQLMRSRYTAYALGDEPYLLRSWHPSTRPPAVPVDGAVTWTGLAVLATSAGGPLDADGVVAFEARFERGGRPGVLRERSRFVRHDLRWVYLDGE